MTPYYTDPAAPGTKRSVRLRVQQQQQQQAQAAASTTTTTTKTSARGNAGVSKRKSKVKKAKKAAPAKNPKGRRGRPAVAERVEEEEGEDGAREAIPSSRPGTPEQLPAPPAPAPAPATAATHEAEPLEQPARLPFPGYGASREHLHHGPNEQYLSRELFNQVPDSISYLGATWERAANIGSGAYGQVDLYVRLDDAGKIAERMAVKTAYVPHDLWTQARMWHSDPSKQPQQQHMEIAVMEALVSVPGEHKCVRLQHSTTDRARLSFRLYTSYHPHGSLAIFNDPESFYATHENKVPEPALWKWLEDLTEAGVFFSTGAAPGSPAVEGWKKIVHCDLKPANVFLDSPDPNLWASYPSAVVGDYGLSVFTDENDALNPSLYNAMGTVGWMAPEQVIMVEKESRRIADTGKLCDASNVWNIGRIIMSLMNREDNPEQPLYDADVRGQMEPQLSRKAKETYSPHLCNLVERCVRFRTYHRITLSELREGISRYTDEDAAPYDAEIDGPDMMWVEMLKAGIHEQKYGAGSHEWVLRYPAEKYRVGLSVEEAQAPEPVDEDENDDDLGGDDDDDDMS